MMVCLFVCFITNYFKQWAAEKWKFQKGNMLQFYNKVTHGFIHLSPDGTVDALGDKKNKYGNFLAIFCECPINSYLIKQKMLHKLILLQTVLRNIKEQLIVPMQYFILNQ